MSLYWKCQIAGWSFYGLLAAGIPSLYGGMRWTVALRTATGIAIGLFLTDQLRRFMLRRGWLWLPLRRLAPRVVFAAVIVTGVMVLILLPLLLLTITAAERTGPLTTIFSIHLIFVLGWILLYLGYHNLRRVHLAEAEKLRLELGMRETELKALRAQLNPHFLFNSLNSLRGLITENPSRAQEAVTRLAALLRHTLQLSRARTTTLEEELEATKHYLELESLRFESRLRYEIDSDLQSLDVAVPPMLIQNLVENAIKHGIARLPKGGSVRVDVQRSSQDLHIRVTNTGTLGDEPGRRGIGLTNSLERLRLMFGEGVSFQLRQLEPSEVACDVVVPIGTRQPAHTVSHPPSIVH
ncbi:MAG: sensor histidine kinase [Gemmatimonas sp.]|nr:sensor histidine kinase [Gemmatimonas sp.]